MTAKGRLLLLLVPGVISLATVSCIAVLTGCAGTSSNPEKLAVLSVQETKSVLRSLPYRYIFREVRTPAGAYGAVAGRVRGKHRTVLNFGISLGDAPERVPVPGAGTLEFDSEPQAGFVLTDDLQVPNGHGGWKVGERFKSVAQWREANNMEVAIVEALCRAATGEPCPV